jgi:predicted secreted hydrolase
VQPPLGTLQPSLPTLQPVMLPADHGAHPGFQVEWWYTAGTAVAANGRSYFWFATIWTGEGLRVAKVNVVDLQADRIVLSNEYYGLGALAAGQTALDVGAFDLDWQPAGTLGRWSVDAPVPGGGELKLNLIPVQPYVLNGVNGIVPQGRGQLSAYYSDPRLAALGTVEIGGKSVPVLGQGWLDHQWGNFAFDPSSLHWNWFACQFRDGSDLMLYQFITRSGVPTGVQNATFVSRDGTVTHPASFTVMPLAPTTRPAGATGTYPLRWRLVVPSSGIAVTLDARALNQFIANRVVPSFWEGSAAITSGPPGTCIVESTRESIFSGFSVDVAPPA